MLTLLTQTSNTSDMDTPNHAPLSSTPSHDDLLRQIRNAGKGHHLVLAGPGCGKTQMLSERICQALSQGIGLDDMLCLTFTNRAARGMVERIKTHLPETTENTLFVGNVHRFCSKFLYENDIISRDTSIIDELDIISIIARYMDEDEYKVATDGKRKSFYINIMFLSHLIRQVALGHEPAMRLHPECIGKTEIISLKNLCTITRQEFTPQTMIDFYEHADTYIDLIEQNTLLTYTQNIHAKRLLMTMDVARKYELYKQENNLLDFEDLLILTYESLKNDERLSYKRYAWIQVDEVQDLNPMQIEIIRLLETPHDGTVMYFGDNLQAIFSFMGAKLHTLDMLKERCAGHIHHLGVNHRLPQYLLQVCNTYARQILGIDPQYLPQSADLLTLPPSDALQVIYSTSIESEYSDVVRHAVSLRKQYPDERVAIIVNTNREADHISQMLDQVGAEHFKVSGQDLFASEDVKLLFAHLNVIQDEHRFMAWAKIAKGLKVCETNTGARNFVRSCLNHHLLPSDLLSHDSMTYLQRFIKTYDSQEIVVFDTETTGLDVTQDDIIQIAAVTIKNGNIVEGSHFSIFLSTRREIPQMLGQEANPILQIIARAECLPPETALKRFMEYVGDRMLIGHNSTFDYLILLHNLKRHLPQATKCLNRHRLLDTLKLTRLLTPDLKEYKLKTLLENFRLEGKNSHLADEDVEGTVNLMKYCYEKAMMVISDQQKFLQRKRVMACAVILKARYSAFYQQAMDLLYEQGVDTAFRAEQPILQVFETFYDHLIGQNLLKSISRLTYISAYIRRICDIHASDTTLYMQLARQVIMLNTLKEVDLCGMGIADEGIHVSTVHKAKGLEFENVIVFHVMEGSYPGFFSLDDPKNIAEDARKMYVALSRAKKRLWLSQSRYKIFSSGNRIAAKPSRFLDSISEYFTPHTPE